MITELIAIFEAEGGKVISEIIISYWSPPHFLWSYFVIKLLSQINYQLKEMQKL